MKNLLLISIIAGLSAFAEPIGVTVDGTDVGKESGDGWTYNPTTKRLLFSESKSYRISGSNTDGAVVPMVDLGKDVTIVMDGVCDLGTDFSLRRQASLTIDSAKADELCELRLSSIDGTDEYPVEVCGGRVVVTKIKDTVLR